MSPKSNRYTSAASAVGFFHAVLARRRASAAIRPRRACHPVTRLVRGQGFNSPAQTSANRPQNPAPIHGDRQGPQPGEIRSQGRLRKAHPAQSGDARPKVGTEDRSSLNSCGVEGLTPGVSTFTREIERENDVHDQATPRTVDQVALRLALRRVVCRVALDVGGSVRRSLA
jgi:hypothetical protein